MNALLPVLLFSVTLSAEEAPYWLYEGYGLPLELVPHRLLWSLPAANIIDVSTPEKRAAVQAALERRALRISREGPDPSEFNCMGFNPEPIPLLAPELPDWQVRQQLPLPPTSLTPGQVRDLVNQVNAQRYIDTVAELTSVGSRHTFSPTLGQAKDYIAAEFAAAGLRVTRQTFMYQGSQHENIIGLLEGQVQPKRFLIVGGHYDSLPTTTVAPGAEDNASGTAGVIEIARVLANSQPDISIIFIAWGVEEQGLKGSYHYVASMSDEERQNFVAALMTDMIAYTSDEQLDVQLDTRNDVGAWVVDAQVAAAQHFTNLVVFRRTSFLGRSDHQPFIEWGLPASLAIENEWNAYLHYHKVSDTLDRVSAAQGAEIVKMQVATVAMLANPARRANVKEAWTLY